MSRIYTKEEIQKRSALTKFSDDIYRKAAAEGMNLTTYLEKHDQSEPDDTTDAFERQMINAGIRTKSDNQRGIHADKVERFYASNQPQSEILFPEFINRTVRIAIQEQSYLSTIVAVRTPVDSDTYRSIYLELEDKESFRMKRTAESAEIPTAKISTKDQAINLHKYGIRLIATYEAVRRMRIDMLSLHLAQISLQTALDKQAQAIEVIVNGDGNGNAAPSDKTTDFDATATTSVTYKAWIGWLMQFFPYQCNVVIGNSNSLLEMLTMNFPSMDPLALLALTNQANQGTAVPTRVEIQPGIFTNILLLLNNNLPDSTFVGIDSRFALEEVYEIGSNLTETDKIIKSQFNEIVISEVVGYAKLYEEAARVLTIG